MDDSGQKRADTLRALVWMTGAIVSFISMAVAARAVSFDLDTFEIMLWRSVTGIIIVCAVLTTRGLWGQVNARQMRLHGIRNLAHFTGQNLWFYAITVIPLAQVFALEFTSPLWVLLLAPLILGERMTKVRGLSALIGFAGILIVTRPGTGEINAGVICAAVAAIGFATTNVLTRKLTRTASVACILFWLTVLQALFGLICAGYDGDLRLPSAVTAPWLLLIGCAGLLAHFCLTNALRLAPASVVMPVDFARLPLVAVIGALIYAEPLDPWVLLGAAVIFAGNYLNIRAETRA
ncbi:multidrug DMT transporter permease [Oceanicola sp. 22II-s10i]|uniref:DMT family transporter n=1 Tax=Oceanicola sp. 22II-s10i TaxID=1317116 RepID=UPI000B5281B7|nr:DMT family transporter [Oceanicola sp. 22II-s10i]OWU84842.1 multidrug DMT transporter permease [Oceanicola sp. 22II-s10i]